MVLGVLGARRVSRLIMVLGVRVGLGGTRDRLQETGASWNRLRREGQNFYSGFHFRYTPFSLPLRTSAPLQK